MQSLKFWQVDAFSCHTFCGNPAAVIYLDQPLDEITMQQIASENNLAETAFIVLTPNSNHHHIRWFTPAYEIDLCGHATLASAHIYFNHINKNATEVSFESQTKGTLKVNKKDHGYTLDFPMYDLKPLALDKIPSHILSALSDKNPLEAYFARDYLFVYDNEKTILDMKPQFDQIKQDEKIIVTAKSNGKYDFISRFFCPDININEDSVTGSAHCALTPYWSKALNKNHFKAYQASKRGGEMEIEFKDNRVLMTGNAKTVIEGTFYL